MIENATTLPQGADTQVFCYDDLSRLTWAGSTATPGCNGAPTPPVNEIEPQEAPPSGAFWCNRPGQLTNGVYTVDEPGMQPHLPYTEASHEVDPNNGWLKSVFLSDLDAHKAVLDAALNADNQAL